MTYTYTMTLFISHRIVLEKNESGNNERMIQMTNNIQYLHFLSDKQIKIDLRGQVYHRGQRLFEATKSCSYDLRA